MCFFDVILLSDIISPIGPKISDADTYVLIVHHPQYIINNMFQIAPYKN